MCQVSTTYTGEPFHISAKKIHTLVLQYIVALLWKVKHTPSYIRGEGEGERSLIWRAGPWLDHMQSLAGWLAGLLKLTR